VPVVFGDVVEAREVADEQLEQAVAVVVQRRRRGRDEVVEPAVVALDERRSRVAQDLRPLVEHLQLGRPAAEEMTEVVRRDLREVRPVEHVDALGDRAVQAIEQCIRVGVHGAVHDLVEAHARLEVGVREVQEVRDEDEVDHRVAVELDCEGEQEARERQLLVGEPLRDVVYARDVGGHVLRLRDDGHHARRGRDVPNRDSVEPSSSREERTARVRADASASTRERSPRL